MTNRDKALLSLAGVALLAGAYKESARKAGWSTALIAGAFFVATHASDIRRRLG